MKKLFTASILLCLAIFGYSQTVKCLITEDFFIKEYSGFTVNFNTATKNPNYVFYTLTREMVNVDNKNLGNRRFFKDPTLNQNLIPSHNDYTNSHYDRGHMAPVEDFDDSEELMIQTMTSINMCPQVPHLNRHGAWRRSELYGEELTRLYPEVFIVCGPIFDNISNLPNTDIRIPSAFFKIFVYKVGDHFVKESFVIPNNIGTSKDLTIYQVNNYNSWIFEIEY